MSRSRSRLRGATICLALIALVAGPASVCAEESRQTAGDRLARLVEDYYDELLRLHPLLATQNGDPRFNDRLAISISPEHRRRSMQLEQRALVAAEAIPMEELDEADRLTRELFLHGRRQAFESYRFPAHRMPLDPLQSMPVLLAMLGGGGSIQPFETVVDYENWLSRLDAWAPWVDQAIVNMREGIETGVVLPRVIVERLLPMLEAQIVDDPSRSVFYGPIERMPSSFAAADRQRLRQAYDRAIREKVVPPYRKLHAFVAETYLPAARKTIGLSELPGGEAWYAFEVRSRTTVGLTPKQIHKLGRKEVSRIVAEIERVQRRPWKSPAAIDDADAADGDERLLDGYRALRARVESRLPDLFSSLPRTDFEIRPVESFRRRSAPGAAYSPGTPDGKRPGVFFVNASPTTRGVASEALFLHEAIPGHHFQISLQREQERLPRFRRFGHDTAYVEGWALYVESLGEQLGLYRSREQKLRALRSELFRARRLVVDTGVHAMGWSRAKAIDYLGSEREVDRYIVWPAQALAYKIGELRLIELRRQAEESLGDRFDLRQFHELVLSEGSMPLDILTRRVEAWIEREAAAGQDLGRSPSRQARPINSLASASLAGKKRAPQ